MDHVNKYVNIYVNFKTLDSQKMKLIGILMCIEIFDPESNDSIIKNCYLT